MADVLKWVNDARVNEASAIRDVSYFSFQNSTRAWVTQLTSSENCSTYK